MVQKCSSESFFDAKDPPCAWIFRFIKHTLPQSNNNDKHNHYNTTMSDSTLILIGGTGGLGAEVAKGLVTSTAYTEKKALVRSAEKATALKDLGYTLVEFSAYDQPEELVNVLKGAHTIVSTLGGGDMAKLEIAVSRPKSRCGPLCSQSIWRGLSSLGGQFSLFGWQKDCLGSGGKSGSPYLHRLYWILL